VSITFQKLSVRYLPEQGRNIAYLQSDNWDDFGHKTLFYLTVFDEEGKKHSIGNVKIGFVGQNMGWTKEQIDQQFEELPENFYSLGQDADYYRNLVDCLPNEMALNVLTALGDVTHNSNRLAIAETETAFKTSLLRSVNRSTIEHQFRRILRREAPLTDYDFFYTKEPNERYSGITVKFKVQPNSKPSSNIHILIGRNGIGKTTLLNNMVDALIPNRGDVTDTGYFATSSNWMGPSVLNEDYFAGVVSVSFSAFDPFLPPEDQPDANSGMRYHYVGLKKRVKHQDQDQWISKSKNDLCQDLVKSLKLCLTLVAKRNRWVNAVKKLE